MILLDTSVLIDYFRKANKQNAFFFQLAQTSSEFAIASISKYEIEVGAKPQDMAFWIGLYQNIAVISFDEAIASETVAINKELKTKSKLIDSCYALSLYNRDDSLNLQKKLDKSI